LDHPLSAIIVNIPEVELLHCQEPCYSLQE